MKAEFPSGLESISGAGKATVAVCHPAVVRMGNVWRAGNNCCSEKKIIIKTINALIVTNAYYYSDIK